METVYYTPKEVAERLKLRVQTIYDYIRKGRLPAVRLGNRCRIAESDLDAFLERNRSDAPSAARKSGDETAAPSSGEGATRRNVAAPADSAELCVPGGVTNIEREEQIRKNQAVRELLAEWMADESGYDEAAWPIVKELIEENRLSDRKRFSD
jgi:excisionase family DNA binding protein